MLTDEYYKTKFVTNKNKKTQDVILMFYNKILNI